MARRSITGLAPQREQALTERMTLRLARAYEPRITREIYRATKDIASGNVNAIDTHEQNMNKILTGLYSRAFKEFGQRMWNAIKKSNTDMEVKRDGDVPLTPYFDLARQLWIKANAASKVTLITGTTSEQAKKIIQEAAAEAVGLGYDEKQTARLIQQRIAEDGGTLSRLRSRVISRTESHAASNASTQMAAVASGLPMMKEWVASISDRTREDHAIANGQVVKMDEPFIVGGEQLMYAGDPSGSAEQVINCRCSIVYSLP